MTITTQQQQQQQNKTNKETRKPQNTQDGNLIKEFTSYLMKI